MHAVALQIKIGNGLKVEGVLGCCASGEVKNSIVSDTEMGIGGTCQWKFCSLTPRNTIAVLLEIAGQVRDLMMILDVNGVCNSRRYSYRGFSMELRFRKERER